MTLIQFGIALVEQHQNLAIFTMDQDIWCLSQEMGDN